MSQVTVEDVAGGKRVQFKLHDKRAAAPARRFKRDRLPSATTLFRAEGRIVGWWEQAYLGRAESHLPEQFLQEARASLPAFATEAAGDIFASVCLQRIRLRHDQQVPEWEGGL